MPIIMKIQNIRDLEPVYSRKYSLLIHLKILVSIISNHTIRLLDTASRYYEYQACIKRLLNKESICANLRPKFFSKAVTVSEACYSKASVIYFY